MAKQLIACDRNNKRTRASRSSRRYRVVHFPHGAGTVAFVELKTFRRRWEELGLEDSALRQLQLALGEDPEAGRVVPGTGNLRKLRFAPANSGQGKSGRYWVYYANIPVLGVIVLAVIFRKNEAADISAQQRKNLVDAIAVVESVFQKSKGNQ